MLKVMDLTAEEELNIDYKVNTVDLQALIYE